jgi:hypothetical protein
MHPSGVEPEPIAWKAIILPLDHGSDHCYFTGACKSDTSKYPRGTETTFLAQSFLKSVTYLTPIRSSWSVVPSHRLTQYSPCRKESWIFPVPKHLGAYVHRSLYPNTKPAQEVEAPKNEKILLQSFTEYPPPFLRRPRIPSANRRGPHLLIIGVQPILFVSIDHYPGRGQWPLFELLRKKEHPIQLFFLQSSTLATTY